MDYSEPCQYSTRLIEKLQSIDTDEVLDFDLINKAIYWAKKYHDGQFRKSGEPFYTHPLEVAYMLSEYKLKTDTTVAAILHDIVEDTKVTAGMILDQFGRRIEKMVDILTRDRSDGNKLTVEEILNNAYKKDDKEVLLIKVIDRLHNMQTIKYKTIEQQNRIAKETIKNFLTLSMHYEFDKIGKELYKICTKIIIKKYNQSQKNYSKYSLINNDCFVLSPTFQNEITQMQNKYLKSP